MRLKRLRFELGMKLAAHEVRMVRQFHHFDISPIRCRTGNAQTRGNHWLFVFPIEFVAMAVTLADLKLAVDFVCQRGGLNFAGPGSQSHGSTQFFYTAEFAEFIDHAMRRCGIELARICFRQSNYIAGKLDACGLHPQANSKVWNFIFARITNCNQHAFDAALTKTAGNENTVIALELRIIGVALAALKSLRFNPVDL